MSSALPYLNSNCECERSPRRVLEVQRPAVAHVLLEVRGVAHVDGEPVELVPEELPGDLEKHGERVENTTWSGRKTPFDTG